MDHYHPKQGWFTFRGSPVNPSGGSDLPLQLSFRFTTSLDSGSNATMGQSNSNNKSTADNASGEEMDLKKRVLLKTMKIPRPKLHTNETTASLIIQFNMPVGVCLKSIAREQLQSIIILLQKKQYGYYH